jgi:uncharacterized protein
LFAAPATEKAISRLLGLAAVADRDPGFTEAERETMTETAPDMIGPMVLILNEWRLANCKPAQMSRSLLTTTKSKVGRNEPCPCGSGKKYKKCCGMN